MPRNIDFSQQAKEVQLAAHAIGLDNKRPYQRHAKYFYRPYRNRFATHDKAPDFKAWEGMVANGHAVAYAGTSGGNACAYYHLTRKGLDWLGDSLGIIIYDEED